MTPLFNVWKGVVEKGVDRKGLILRKNNLNPTKVDQSLWTL